MHSSLLRRQCATTLLVLQYQEFETAGRVSGLNVQCALGAIIGPHGEQSENPFPLSGEAPDIAPCLANLNVNKPQEELT